MTDGAGWRLALAAVVVVAAGSTAVLVAAALLRMTSDEFRELALYIAGTSAASLAVGSVVLVLVDRVLKPSLAVRAFLGALTGTLTAFAHVLLMSSLMFVNTDHDLRLLIVLLATGGFVTVFFSVLVAQVTARRLDVLRQLVRRLAEHDYSPPASVTGGGSEVAQLAADIESLRIELSGIEAQRAALQREQRELTAAISHDLRTPVATVRAMVDALEDGVVERPDEVLDYYGRIRRETQRLSSMIDDLLQLARLDAGALPLDLRPVALQDVVAEVIDALRPQAERGGVELRLALEGEPPPVHIDAAQIERAVANLVRNALAHTPSGGEVRLSVVAAPSEVRLVVADTGSGIAAADLERIWDRFYRAEQSRSSRVGEGSGLGLAIVRGIVEAHRGRVDVTSRPGAGAAFTVSVPLGG